MPPPKRFQPRGLAILHEDDAILVVDKAAGLLTVSSASEREKTAYFLLNDYVRKGQAKSRKRVFIVHRLDRDTSGLLVFAKTEEAKRALQAAWADSVRKLYVAVVEGRPKSMQGEIVSYLAENDAQQVYSSPDPARGKLARTGYRVLKAGARFSLLELELHTGRKNQIRVHLAELGHPVAGDSKYGARLPGVKRLCLHAASLAFAHPRTGEAVAFQSPVPDYFKSLLGGAGDR